MVSGGGGGGGAAVVVVAILVVVALLVVIAAGVVAGGTVWVVPGGGVVGVVTTIMAAGAITVAAGRLLAVSWALMLEAVRAPAVLEAAELDVCTMLTIRLVETANSLLDVESTVAVTESWQLEHVIPLAGMTFTTGQPVHPAKASNEARIG